MLLIHKYIHGEMSVIRSYSYVFLDFISQNVTKLRSTGVLYYCIHTNKQMLLL